MEIAQEKRGAVFVIGPVGRLDTDSAADLELALQDLLAAGATHFVVDLAQINYVSSAGLRVLLQLAKSVEKKGSLRIAGLNAQVQQVFDIAGFTKLFQIHPDRRAALHEHPEAGAADPEPAAAAVESAPRAASKERAAPTEQAAPPAAAPREASPAKPADAPREAAPSARRDETPAPPREAAPPPRPTPAPAEAREAPQPPARPAPAPVESREAAAPPRPAPAPVESREPSPPPRPAPAPVESREPPPPAPTPVAPKVVAPTLAEHVARLLAAGPATNTPIDASVNALSRHAAMLLGVKLDGAPAASGSAKPGAATKPAPAAHPPAAEETDEKGGLLSRLFGKKKRSNL